MLDRVEQNRIQQPVAFAGRSHQGIPTSRVRMNAPI